MAIVVIDPGHGGSETIPNDSTWNNAVGPGGTLEKNLTLNVGLRVAAALSARGHAAILTRATDVNLRLRDRAAVARSRKAAVFVSIHFNGSRSHDAQGTETLVETNHTVYSARLSLTVQDALLRVTGLRDRNKSFNPSTRIKPQSLGVLKLDRHHPETAACLAEVSFLDRADEEERLRNPAYLEAIGGAIAAGIDAYLGTLLQSRAISLGFGDAIEAAAETHDEAQIEKFLSLDMPVGVRRRVMKDAEACEVVAMPPKPFSRAFLSGEDQEFIIDRSAARWDKVDAFAAFIEGLGLRYFSPDEFLELGASNRAGECKGMNTFPPEILWPSIANTAIMLDAIRAEMGAAIRILSCYRSAAYNACIKGEANSLHTKFNAIDFTCQAGTPEIWRRIAARLRKEDSRFVGGIGIYPKRNFVHIDTRGVSRDWQGT